MNEKTIHIVFQVINCLTDELTKKYKLLPIDKWILTVLASHHGKDGIYPRQDTIARRVQVSLRYAKTRIKFLEDSGLISIKRIGKKNHYFLDFISDPDFTYHAEMGEPQITYSVDNSIPSQTIGDPQITTKVIHRSPYRGSTDHTNNSINNKERNNKERERKKRALTLSDFLSLTKGELNVDEEMSNYFGELGFAQNEIDPLLDKFVRTFTENPEHRDKKKLDWHYAIKCFFEREADFLNKKKEPNQNVVVPIRSTYEPSPPVSDEQQIRNQLKISELIKGLNFGKGANTYDKDNGRVEKGS